MGRGERNEKGGRKLDGPGIFLLALAAGLLSWHLLAESPFLAHPIIDAAEYLAEARALASGLPYWESTPIHGPVYPLLLTPVVASAERPLPAIYLVQILLVACSALLVRSAAFGIGGRRMANLAGLLVALAPPLLYFQVQVLPVIVQVFLHSLLLWLLLRGGGGRRVFIAGLVGGLSYLTHPGCGVALLLVALFLFRKLARRESALFVAGLLLPLLPVSLLNLRVGEAPLPITGNAGLNLYVGNGEDSDGTPHIRPGYEWERLSARPLLQGVEGSAAQNRFFLRETVKDAERAPAAFLRRLGAKALLFGSIYPIDASQDPVYFADRSFLLRLYPLDAVLLFPLALALLFLPGTKPPRLVLPMLGILGYWVGTTVTVYAIRYRAPVWPFLAITASYLPFYLRASGRAAVVRAAALVAGWILLTHVLLMGYRGKSPVRTDYNLGRLLYTRGDFAGAREEFLHVWEKAPEGDPDGANALGVLAMESGRPEEAEWWLAKAIGTAPDYADAHFNLALLQIRQGETEDAARNLDRAIQLYPGHAPALYTRGILYERGGETGEAERFYRSSLRFDSRNEDAWTALAFLLLREERRAEGEEALRRAIEINPHSPKARNALIRLRSR